MIGYFFYVLDVFDGAVFVQNEVKSHGLRIIGSRLGLNRVLLTGVGELKAALLDKEESQAKQ